jgi:MazG family protein
MKTLLGPDGCPWDREQSLDSLRPYLVEETFEVLDALESGTPAEHCEELGDLLFQVVFQSELRNAAGAFAIDDVVRSIVDKLVRRHPHIFGTAEADTSEAVLVKWDQIKAEERRAKAKARGEDPEAAARRSALDGVPLSMPGLARAQALTARAARVGFDWPDADGPRTKVTEELAELDDAVASGDQAAVERELGDVLFAAVNLARKHGVDADAALRGTVRRFRDRFRYVETGLEERGTNTAEATLEEMDALWDEAKTRED